MSFLSKVLPSLCFSFAAARYNVRFMKLRALLFLLAVILSIPPARAAEQGSVYVIELHGEVSPAQFFLLRRGIKEAERHGASAVVLDIDTLGGSIAAAIDEMDALMKTTIPTFTYVNNKALSAGALISLATQNIYMSPTGVIGAAAPVSAGGEDLSKTENEKAISAFSALGRAAAQKSGHNPALADSFIRKEAQLKIGEVLIDGPDTLLTLSAQEAARQFEGKPLLARGIAPSLDALLHDASLPAATVRIVPSGFELLAFWLTSIAPFLLLGGIVCAFLEFKTPGATLPGVAAAVCFALFFTSNYIAGLAGWEVVVLFALGVGLLISEVFVHPGTVLPGIAGIALIFGALIWAMVDRYPGEPLLPTSGEILMPLLKFTVAIVLAAVVIALLARFLPKTSFFRRVVLSAATPSGASGIVAEERFPLAIGTRGTARTTLRPSGKAEIEGQLVDVVSRGDFIQQGALLKVVAIEGGRVVIAACSAD